MTKIFIDIQDYNSYITKRFKKEIPLEEAHIISLESLFIELENLIFENEHLVEEKEDFIKDRDENYTQNKNEY